MKPLNPKTHKPAVEKLGEWQPFMQLDENNMAFVRSEQRVLNLSVSSKSDEIPDAFPADGFKKLEVKSVLIENEIFQISIPILGCADICAEHKQALALPLVAAFAELYAVNAVHVIFTDQVAALADSEPLVIAVNERMKN